MTKDNKQKGVEIEKSQELEGNAKPILTKEQIQEIIDRQGEYYTVFTLTPKSKNSENSKSGDEKDDAVSLIEERTKETTYQFEKYLNTSSQLLKEYQKENNQLRQELEFFKSSDDVRNQIFIEKNHRISDLEDVNAGLSQQFQELNTRFITREKELTDELNQTKYFLAEKNKANLVLQNELNDTKLKLEHEADPSLGNNLSNIQQEIVKVKDLVEHLTLSFYHNIIGGIVIIITAFVSAFAALRYFWKYQQKEKTKKLDHLPKKNKQKIA